MNIREHSALINRTKYQDKNFLISNGESLRFKKRSSALKAEKTRLTEKNKHATI